MSNKSYLESKKEQRRLKILLTAAELFLQKGFERTSMEEINTRLGCSKTTLYKYFPSKEELFVDAVQFTIREQADSVFTTITQLQNEENFWPGLVLFANNYLTLQLSPMMLSVNRLVIAEGEREGIGELMYQRGPLRAWQSVATHLQKAMERKVIRQSDPLVAALQLKGLLETGMVDKRLRGALLQVSCQEIQQQVEQAIDTFRRAYQY